jgi:hypothetical protein
MLDSKGVQCIGQILNSSTWGAGGDGLRACRGNLQGEVLKLRFSTVFYFENQHSMADQQRRLAQESEDYLKVKLREIKDQYMGECEKALGAKVISDSDDVELISSHANTARRVAYYHRQMVFELS